MMGEGRRTTVMSFALSKFHQKAATAIAELASAYEIDLEENLSSLVESVSRRKSAMP